MLVAGKAEPKRGIWLWEKPEPKIVEDNDVLLEVEACGVCGTDLEIYEWPEENLPAWMRTLPLPVVLGHETVGRVREVGPTVTRFKLGDRVVHASTGGCGVCYFCRSGLLNLCGARASKIPGIMSDGAYARYAIITDYALFKIPEEISTADAAVLQPLTVAVHAMGIGRPGDIHVIALKKPDIIIIACGIPRAVSPLRVVEAIKFSLGIKMKLAHQMSLISGLREFFRCQSVFVSATSADQAQRQKPREYVFGESSAVVGNQRTK